MRTVDIKLEVLRHGSRVCELVLADTPRLTVDGQSAIKGSLSAAVLPNEAVNWLSDELSPVLTVDGKEHRLGVYAAADVLPSVDASGFKRVRLTAYDRCWRVKTVKWVTARKLSAGTAYLDAIEALLIEAGIERVIKLPSDYALSDDRTFDLGTDYLTIINQLLGEINYDQLRFDANGAAVLYPVSRPDPAHITQRLTQGDVKSLLLPEMSRATDIFEAPNVFVCVCSAPGSDAPLVARAVNDSPLSPLSTISRGREITKFVSVKDIADQSALDAYADQLRWESMGMGEVVTVRTALRPEHKLGDVVALVTDEATGIYTETGYSMELRAGGVMSHTLRRIIYTNG